MTAVRHRPFELHCYTDSARPLPAGVVRHDCSGWTELDRPGMRGIMQCSGAVTYFAFTGDKDVGQSQPIKTFKVSRKKRETSADLSCLSDFRKQTKHMALPWEDASAVAKAKGGTQPAANDDDDVPF